MSSFCKKIASYLILINYVIFAIHAHGRLVDPPGRASMWRYGYRTHVDYNDNQLFCGGFNIQHFVNGGKCGICGDAYGSEQRNQPPGSFASGIISRTYTAGTNVTMQFEITASHRGYLEFRICPNNDVTKPATQACLDQYLLSDVVTGGTKFYFNYGTVGLYTAYLSLPSGLTCSQCVVQWRYRTGNSWGCVDDDIEKECGIGFGRQEEFYACADVAIAALDGSNPSTTVVTNQHSSTSLPTTPPSTSTKVITEITSTSSPSQPTTLSTTSTTYDATSITSPAQPTTPSSKVSTPQVSMSSTSSPTSPRTSQISTQTKTQVPTSQTPSNCIAIGPYQGNPNMDRWCSVNCELGYCPASHCSPNCNQTSAGPSTTTNVPSMPTLTTVSTTPSTTQFTNTATSTIETSVSTTVSTTTSTTPTSPEAYCPPLDRFSDNPEYAKWCARSCLFNYCSPFLCKCNAISSTGSSTKLSTSRPTTEGAPTNKLVCIGAGVWREDTSMAAWCGTNCKLGHCPPSTCQCSKDGSLQDMTYGLGDKCYTVMPIVSSKYKQYMDLWCKHNCPSFGCWNIPNICKC